MANNTKRTLYLIFIFILLLTNIVAGYFWLNSNKDNDKLTAEKSELQTEYLGVQQNLNTQIAALTEMKGKNAKLDSIISIREKEITDQQAKITKLFKQKNFTASELKKAKDMISSLEMQNTGFMIKIDSLNKYADQLFLEKQGLETDLNTQKEVNANLEDKNKYLDDKFELGALLRADELTMNGIFVKKNGVEKNINRIKKVEKLKICYQTGDNKVRENGQATMYLIINTPNGQTLYNEANGSGTMKSKSGETIRYSKKAEFDFDGKNKNICIYWTQDFVNPGVYKALVFQDGYLVGESSTELK